jgi:hypothetical protein
MHFTDMTQHQAHDSASVLKRRMDVFSPASSLFSQAQSSQNWTTRMQHRARQSERSPLFSSSFADSLPTSGESVSRHTLTNQSRSTRTQRTPADHWQGRFLNRDANNVDDYDTYNFRKADAILDLGDQGQRGSLVAQLFLDYGRGSPNGIQNHHFAMQAQTRIRLREGYFYQLRSDSDDGTRFLFENRTSDSLTEVAGDWQRRSTREPTWKQTLRADEAGVFDFFVQYYENLGDAVVDVSLKREKPRAEVVASTLNVRSLPSTLNNTPIDQLSRGESIRILRQVTSPDDSQYSTWYEIVTPDKQRGFVAADETFVQWTNRSTVLPLGDAEQPSTPPTGGGGSYPISGVIAGYGLSNPNSAIALRSDARTNATALDWLTVNTSLRILDQVPGGTYGNGYDLWYEVSYTENGQTERGYVASYYVDAGTTTTKFPTAISKENPYFTPHLAEITQPRYYSSSYQPMIKSVASNYAWVKPSIVAAIGSRESGWGLFLSPRGPAGTGDGGHGRGLMQIDDRYHPEFINSGLWSNPLENIRYAVGQVLNQSYQYLDRATTLDGVDLLRGAIAAYNAGVGNVISAVNQGLDVDYYTTGRDYSWDVLNRAGWFQSHGWK